MNYLAIITRSDFTNLYKFGHIHLHNLVPFDGNLKDHINDKNLFDAVTKYIDTYEYATEYLLLHITKEVFTELIVEININDVKVVYALSAEAKSRLQISFDSRINIQVSMWESLFAELNIEQAIRQAKIGLNNCLEIFGITPSEKSEIYKILPKNLVEEVYNDVFNNVRPSENASIWNYLMRYERHNPYWNDKRGFFMDAVHVYENHNKGYEIDYGIVDEMPIGGTISDCPNAFTTILQKLNETGENKYNVCGCNYLVAAPLFLYLKAEFKDGGITPSNFDQNRNLFASLHETYGLDFGIAISLLGLSLGQDLTYNYAYQHNNIGIFNTTQDEIDGTDNLIERDSTKEKHPSIEDLQNIIESQSEEIRNLNEKIRELNSKHVSESVALGIENIGEGSPAVKSTDVAFSSPECVIPQEEHILSVENPINVQPETQVVQNVAECESDTDSFSGENSFSPIKMIKLHKTSNKPLKHLPKNLRIAYSIDEYKQYLQEGFAPINGDNKIQFSLDTNLQWYE